MGITRSTVISQTHGFKCDFPDPQMAIKLGQWWLTMGYLIFHTKPKKITIPLVNVWINYPLFCSAILIDFWLVIVESCWILHKSPAISESTGCPNRQSWKRRLRQLREVRRLIFVIPLESHGSKNDRSIFSFASWMSFIHMALKCGIYI